MPLPSSTPKSPTPTGGLAARMAAPPSATTGALSRIACRPNETFFLLCHPDAWDVVTVKGEVSGVKLDGSFWVPELIKLVEAAGANGIRVVPSGQGPEAAYTGALRARMEDGWTILDRNANIAPVYLPNGVPEGPYMRQIDCQDPLTRAIGLHYLEAWNIPVPSRGSSKQKFRFDRARYNLWRASLVLDGIVEPPSDEVRAELKARAEAKLNRVAILNLPVDIRKQRTDAAAKRVGEIDKARAGAEAAA